MSTSRTTQSDMPLYVAVMGQVGRPGVYELPGSLPQLAEFLNFAGGTTPNASGSIRVIRGGRSSQFFLSPKLSLQLIPDDLVVVESKQFMAGSRAGNTSSANGWQGNPGMLSAAPAPAIVQIGLVNLISRPVVLDLPSEQANLAKVLSLLHQPVTDKGEITIFKPGSGLQSVTLDQASEANLATGMVLMFDPATVNSAVLPRLPNILRPEANTDAAITKTSAEAAESQTTISETASKSQARLGGNLPLIVPGATSSDGLDPGNHSSNPETVDVSPVDSLDQSTAAGQGSIVASESTDSEASSETADERSSDTEPAVAVVRKTFAFPSLVMLAGIVVCCLGILLISGFRRRTQPVEISSQPEPIERQDNSLESLISGALPLVEEPLQLPYETEIFGRPLETSPHRTDPAQALSGPHYAPQPSRSPTTAAVVAEQAEHRPSASSDRNVRVDMRHPRGTASVLDRALATFEGEQP